MKDKLITEIQNEMASVLSQAQLKELGRVLMNSMHSLEITKVADEGQLEIDNQELMRVFLSAKRVEGCSEKSLKYYEMIIAKLMSK